MRHLFRKLNIRTVTVLKGFILKVHYSKKIVIRKVIIPKGVVVLVSTVVICIFMRGRDQICISMDIANLHIHKGRDLICISMNINKGAAYR